MNEYQNIEYVYPKYAACKMQAARFSMSSFFIGLIVSFLAMHSSLNLCSSC